MGMLSENSVVNLAPELRVILDAELEAGNAIAEVVSGSPLHDALVVILEKSFITPLRPASANMRFRQVNLPGWWAAEYTTAQPPHTLACR